jgi:hypothetical protein
MRSSFHRLLSTLGMAAALAPSSQANWFQQTSPSDNIVQASIVEEDAASNDKVIAPTATASSSSASCSAVSCCDNRFRGCDNCCDGGCDSCGCGSGLLGYGIIKPSDRCFDDFISPVSNPVFFEDPRTLTEVRFLFLHHEVPAAVGGHSVQVYAAQVRLALSKRLSLIATKDGFVYSQHPLIEPGFADVAAGFKYNVYRDPTAGRILSVGTTFEIPMGSEKSLQGNGDGEWNFFATAGTRIMGSTRAHWLSAGGLRQPNDEDAENRLMYWSNHFNYRLDTRKPVYLLTEFNWWNYLSDGTAFPLPVEGGDLFNFGSPGVVGNDLVTQAIGMRMKPKSNVEMGSAFEFPLTEREGLLKNRWNFDLIVRY